MEDNEIIALFEQRIENAIIETKIKYGRAIYSIAYHVLGNNPDAEECENDTYLTAWNTIPPQKPKNFKAFVLKIARNLSLKKYEYYHAAKRNISMNVSYEELKECIDNRFKVPVQVNKDGVRTIEVNASKDGYTIDRIVVAPVKTTIYTSFPRMVNWEGIRYAIFFYSDLSKNEVVGEGTYDVEKGKGFSQISTDEIGETLDIYIADFDTLDKEKVKYTRENLDKYAILHEKINLH